jgi:hypothetical protein
VKVIDHALEGLSMNQQRHDDDSYVPHHVLKPREAAREILFGIVVTHLQQHYQYWKIPSYRLHKPCLK